MFTVLGNLLFLCFNVTKQNVCETVILFLKKQLNLNVKLSTSWNGFSKAIKWNSGKCLILNI